MPIITGKARMLCLRLIPEVAFKHIIHVPFLEILIQIPKGHGVAVLHTIYSYKSRENLQPTELVNQFCGLQVFSRCFPSLTS